MNHFEIINSLDKEIPELLEVNKVIEHTLKKQDLKNVEFNIIIVDNKKIQELNNDYRNINRPTDVLSFALEDDEEFNTTDYRLLGDIYISFEKAEEQALEYGHSLLRELSFLAVHGLLHLLGYDHMNEADEKVMFELQERMLSSYGISK